MSLSIHLYNNLSCSNFFFLDTFQKFFTHFTQAFYKHRIRHNHAVRNKGQFQPCRKSFISKLPKLPKLKEKLLIFMNC